MPRKKTVDLTGQKFGKWNVIKEAAPDHNNHRKWLCRCDCGTIREVYQGLLTSHRSTSCGCGRKTDISGQQIGEWTVLYEVAPKIRKDGGETRMFYCRCSCGTERNVSFGALNSGRTMSCGCKPAKEFGEKRKKYNQYDLFDSYGIGHCTNCDDVFFFDIEDYNKIKQHCWTKDGLGYISAYNGKNKKISMHRIIMNVDDSSIQVDHISGNKLDNRKCNLRIVTPMQNVRNCMPTKRNKSGCVGVCWDSNKERWLATICINYHTIYLGMFRDIEDAIAARKAAEEKYFGEYSFDNSQAIAELNKING